MNEKGRWVTLPNLPESEVALCISALPVPGIKTVVPPAISVLPSSMQRHADLQICHLGENVLLAEPTVYAYYKEVLSPLGFEILKGKKRVGSTYPYDAAYNIGRVGNAAFLNPKIADPVALYYFETQGIQVISVRQGYAKCAILPVDEASLITADAGVARAAKHAGFSVLEIAPGGVRLDGFLYGFLGGAAGKTGKKTLYVTGSLSRHPSFSEILSFLEKRGIKSEEGSIPIPIDIGSVLPLLYK